jgi:hypothetical protein
MTRIVSADRHPLHRSATRLATDTVDRPAKKTARPTIIVSRSAEIAIASTITIATGASGAAPKRVEGIETITTTRSDGPRVPIGEGREAIVQMIGRPIIATSEIHKR